MQARQRRTERETKGEAGERDKCAGVAATLLAASFAVFADYSYFGPRVLRCRHLTPSGCPASSIASIASIIIVMTSTLLSAGSGRNPARDGPTPAASVKFVSVCVFFCVLKDFFLCSSGPGELGSCGAVELLDISCAYSLADEVAVSAYCCSAPRATPATDFDSFRFIFLLACCSCCRVGRVWVGGFKRLKLRIHPLLFSPILLST